jgi:hypothetical protein
MWLPRNKLTLLNEELRWVEVFNRFHDCRVDAEQNEQGACVVRQQRRSEILAEMPRLRGGDTKLSSQGWAAN